VWVQAEVEQERKDNERLQRQMQELQDQVLLFFFATLEYRVEIPDPKP
jgi:hypothetical protein